MRAPPLGAITLPEVLRLPAGAVVALVAALAVALFVTAERLMRRLQP